VGVQIYHLSVWNTSGADPPTVEHSTQLQVQTPSTEHPTQLEVQTSSVDNKLGFAGF